VSDGGEELEGSSVARRLANNDTARMTSVVSDSAVELQSQSASILHPPSRLSAQHEKSTGTKATDHFALPGHCRPPPPPSALYINWWPCPISLYRVYAYDLHTRQNGNNRDDGGLRTALWLALVHCLGPLLASTGPGDRPGMIDSARFRFRGQSIAPILAWYLSLRPPPPVLTRYSLMTSWPHGPASHPHLNKTDTVLPTA